MVAPGRIDFKTSCFVCFSFHALLSRVIADREHQLNCFRSRNLTNCGLAVHLRLRLFSSVQNIPRGLALVVLTLVWRMRKKLFCAVLRTAVAHSHKAHSYEPLLRAVGLALGFVYVLHVFFLFFSGVTYLIRVGLCHNRLVRLVDHFC